MVRTLFALALVSWLTLSQAAFAQTPVPPGGSPAQSAPGRYQIVAGQGGSGSPLLLDTMTGCTWQLVHDEKTKRSTFVEVDVENLHWSWGSGAQSMLAARVDGSNLTAQQKQALKQDLQKTGCGLSGVVLTPGMTSATGAPKPVAEKEQPKKR